MKATAANQTGTNRRGGYFGGAGINFNFGRIFLGVEGRFQVLKAPAPAPASSNPSATTDVNMDGVVVTGNIGFRF